MDGTVISDAVNMAHRVEGMTKVFGVALLITENSFERLRDPAQYNIRCIDRVLLKGKSEPVTVYEVFCSNRSGPIIVGASCSTTCCGRTPTACR